MTAQPAFMLDLLAPAYDFYPAYIHSSSTISPTTVCAASPCPASR
jgi:hypothetical protein